MSKFKNEREMLADEQAHRMEDEVNAAWQTHEHEKKAQSFKPGTAKNETKMEKIIDEITGYLETIQQFDKDGGQDTGALHQYLIQLTNFGARCNFLMAEYKRKFRQEKEAAYNTMVLSSKAQEQYFSPSLAKDYIDSRCHKTGFVFDLASRASASCVHTSSAIITILSSLKSERQFAPYSGT